MTEEALAEDAAIDAPGDAEGLCLVDPSAHGKIDPELRNPDPELSGAEGDDPFGEDLHVGDGNDVDRAGDTPDGLSSAPVETPSVTPCPSLCPANA